MDKHIGEECIGAFRSDGRKADGIERSIDLVNVPAERVVWFNLYENEEAVYAHKSKERADNVAGRTTMKRIARAKVLIKEGQFDD